MLYQKLYTMNKKTFLLGVLTGTILTLAIMFVVGLSSPNSGDKDSIQYLESPLNYENKSESSFKVFQVLDNAALASEVSDKEQKLFLGNTVVILGQDFYSDQIVTINNPQRVGTYSYTNKGGMPMTVPVINGEFCE